MDSAGKLNTKDRHQAIREVEGSMERLVVKGWRIESITHRDEADEPFRTQIHMAKDSPSVTDVGL